MGVESIRNDMNTLLWNKLKKKKRICHIQGYVL